MLIVSTQGFQQNRPSRLIDFHFHTEQMSLFVMKQVSLIQWHAEDFASGYLNIDLNKHNPSFNQLRTKIENCLNSLFWKRS